MSSKKKKEDILVVTLSSDEEDETKDEKQTTSKPVPVTPPAGHQKHRQCARKSTSRPMRVTRLRSAGTGPKPKRRPSGSGDSDESGDGTKTRDSESSSSTEDEDYIPTYDAVVETQTSVENNDLPGFSEHLIDLNEKRQMYCPICRENFKDKTEYALHRSRHVAPEHFMCPTCQRGFIRIKDCFNHELEVHHSQSLPNVSSNRKRVEERIPSTCLYAYRGPPIRNMYEPYEIDCKFTKPEKKMTTRIISKRVLEKHREIQENTDALIAEALETQDSQEAEENSSPRVAHISTANRAEHISKRDKLKFDRKAPVPDSQKILNGKRFSCRKCGKRARTRRGIIVHIDDKHPKISGEGIDDYIIETPTEEPSKEPSGVGVRAEASSSRESRPEILVSFNNILQNVCTSPPKQPTRKFRATKSVKKKKVKKITFSKRLDAIRVWEKTKEPLSKSEFLSALSLINNSDVLLGPRQGLRRIESSLFCFRRVHREKSPPPHARIVMNKLPMEQCRHKHVFLCNLCDFTAPTQAYVRNHRRNEHLKGNYSDADETGSQISERQDRNSQDEDGRADGAPRQFSSPSQKEPPVRPGPSPAPLPNVSLTISTDNLPDENINSPLYQCGRCDYKSHDRRAVKTHRQVVHRKISESGSESSQTQSSTSSSVQVLQAQPRVTANTAAHEEEIEYQCDMCDFTSCIRDEVKQHRKAVHKKNITTLTPARPNGGPGQDQRLNNNFAIPHEPPKKKLKPN